MSHKRILWKGLALKLIFAVWLVLWLVFILRDLFVKSNFHDYAQLLPRTLEGRRAYVTGEKFYEFLTACNKIIPENGRYIWVGMEEVSLDKRRADYYLYPRLEAKGEAEFTLICRKSNTGEVDYKIEKNGENVRWN